MADGSITFDTEIDKSSIKKDLDAVKREIDKSTRSIEKMEAAKLPLVEQARELGGALDEAKTKLAALQDQQSAAAQALNGTDAGAYIDAYAAKPGIDAAVNAQQEKVDALEKEWGQVNDRIDRYNFKISQANGQITIQKQKAGELSGQLATGASETGSMETASAGASGNVSAMAAATQVAAKAASKFQRRLGNILKQVLVFGLVSKALYSAVGYMGKLLKSNKDFSKQLAKLKGALLTAFQPIYEILLPALISIMRLLEIAAQSFAHVFAMLSGGSAQKYAENAKALYEQAHATDEVGKAAKKATRSLAGFDQIQTVGGKNEDDLDASAPDFSGFDTNAFKEKIDEMTVYAAEAVLVIGLALLLSGASVPLGIGLIALGATGLATEISTNWDTVRNILQEQSAMIAAIGGILLAIGLILLLSGVNIPLGIALIAAGVVGLVTPAVVNWDALREMLVESFKRAINAVVVMLNDFIGWLNDLFHIRWDAIVVAGFEVVPAFDKQMLSLPNIPYLAQGAVLPANKPFLAMVGDQRHGTNVEAPLATIQEAVANVMGDMLPAMMAGFEAVVEEQRSLRSCVEHIEIGDDVIGQAARRYDRKMTMIRGGV